MDNGGKALGWGGLIGGGLLSLAANVRSLWIPEYTERGDWHSLPTREVTDPGAIIAAVALPIIAVVGVEMVNKWTHLHRTLRFGVVGAVAACAMFASFVHIVIVLMWYGQPIFLAIPITVSVDGLVILSGLALFTKPSAVQPDTDTDTDSAMDMSGRAMDNIVDMSGVGQLADRMADPKGYGQVELSAEPVLSTEPDTTDKVPAQRKPRPDSAWKIRAREIMEADPALTDAEVAAKVTAEGIRSWPTPEAARKAVSRLR